MKKYKSLILTYVTSVLLIIWISPLFMVVINSLKSAQEISESKSSLPTNPISQGLTNLQEIFTDENLRFFTSFLSSTIITVASVTLLVLLSSMASWALVRSSKKWAKFYFLMLVASMVIPFQAVMLPLVSWYSTLDKLIPLDFPVFNRGYVGMILAYLAFGSALCIFMYHSFIKAIPKELEEAAKIDGCTTYQTFFKVVFPMLKPITVTLIILNGIWIWNDYLLPLMILGTGNDIQTLPIGIANFIGSFVKQWELIMMSLLLSIIPVIIVFLIGQKHIIKGMIGGAIK